MCTRSQCVLYEAGARIQECHAIPQALTAKTIKYDRLNKLARKSQKKGVGIIHWVSRPDAGGNRFGGRVDGSGLEIQLYGGK